MSDNYEHKKPYSLTASYLDIVEPSALTAPYDLHVVYDPELVANYLRATLNTGFISEITGLNLQPVDNSGYVEAYISCGLNSLSTGFQDINHQLGVERRFGSHFKKGKSLLGFRGMAWQKSILRVSNEALFFDQGLVISHRNEIGFDRGLTLSESIHAAFNQGIKLSRNQRVSWQENLKIRIARDLYFDESIKIQLNRELAHQEMIRKRRNISFSHQVAHVFEKRFSFDWDKGLELVTQDEIPWDKAKSLHYRKHPIEPWPEPEIPQYEGTGDLEFICLCHEVDSHDVVLNFGEDDCIPGIPNRNWWYILNRLSVTRLDNGVKIEVFDGNYSTDRSCWCWSYSLTVPAAEIGKLEPINGQPVILKIIVNGTEHQMLLENRRRSRKFAQDTYTLIGRSQTALLAAPPAPLRSFLQEND